MCIKIPHSMKLEKNVTVFIWIYIEKNVTVFICIYTEKKRYCFYMYLHRKKINFLCKPPEWGERVHFQERVYNCRSRSSRNSFPAGRILGNWSFYNFHSLLWLFKFIVFLTLSLIWEKKISIISHSLFIMFWCMYETRYCK